MAYSCPLHSWVSEYMPCQACAATDFWEPKVHAERRQQLMNQMEGHFQPQPMFDIPLLRHVFDYYMRKTKILPTAQGFVNYIHQLEKDVPLEMQKAQP